MMESLQDKIVQLRELQLKRHLLRGRLEKKCQIMGDSDIVDFEVKGWNFYEDKFIEANGSTAAEPPSVLKTVPPEDSIIIKLVRRRAGCRELHIYVNEIARVQLPVDSLISSKVGPGRLENELQFVISLQGQAETLDRKIKLCKILAQTELPLAKTQLFDLHFELSRIQLEGGSSDNSLQSVDNNCGSTPASLSEGDASPEDAQDPPSLDDE